MIEKKQIQPAADLQTYIIFLKDEKYFETVKKTITALGGQTLQQFSGMRILLAHLRVKTADQLKMVVGVKHTGPVSITNRIRRLQIKIDEDGNPLWRYKVDAHNRIVRIKNS